MAHTIINSLTTIILTIFFPLTQWATIEMTSNSPQKFQIATTAKHTPCNECVDRQYFNQYFYNLN